jgi:hypothetical protein
MYKSRVLIPILTGFIFCASVQEGCCERFNCGDNHQVRIIADDDTMIDQVCSGSAAALEFLSRYGLRTDMEISIRIVEGPIDSNGYIALGSYDRQSDEISLMSFLSIMNGPAPQMYGQPFDLEHYRGAVAHEVVHAVFYHNSKKTKNQKTNATQEYLAHATQLASLSPERRNRIIADSGVGPWESGDSISDIYMALDPRGFAVKSYLHLTQLEDPQPFMKIILAHSWFYLSVP